jgi:hypothetical protein
MGMFELWIEINEIQTLDNWPIMMDISNELRLNKVDLIKLLKNFDYIFVHMEKYLADFELELNRR